MEFQLEETKILTATRIALPQSIELTTENLIILNQGSKPTVVYRIGFMIISTYGTIKLLQYITNSIVDIKGANFVQFQRMCSIVFLPFSKSTLNRHAKSNLHLIEKTKPQFFLKTILSKQGFYSNV